MDVIAAAEVVVDDLSDSCNPYIGSERWRLTLFRCGMLNPRRHDVSYGELNNNNMAVIAAVKNVVDDYQG